jgi:hypothetical protein
VKNKNPHPFPSSRINKNNNKLTNNKKITKSEK